MRHATIWRKLTGFWLVLVLGLAACGAAGGNSSGLIDALFGGASGLDSGDSSVTGDDSSSNSVEEDFESGSEDIEENLLPPASMPIPSLTSSLTSGADAEGVSWFQGEGLENYTLVITKTGVASTHRAPHLPRIRMLASNPGKPIDLASSTSGILEALKSVSSLVVPEVVADSGYDTTDTNPCNDCDPLESTCNAVCVTPEDGVVAPTAIRYYTMGDTLGFAYYDTSTGVLGESVQDTANRNVVFINQIPAGDEGLTRYDNGAAQISSDGVVKSISYVDDRFVPGGGNADGGYVLARFNSEADKLFFDPDNHYFVVHAGRFLSAMKMDGEELVSAGYDSKTVCPEAQSALSGCYVDEVKVMRNADNEIQIYYTTAPPYRATNHLRTGSIYSLYGGMEPFQYLDEDTRDPGTGEKIDLKNVLGFAFDPPHDGLNAAAVVAIEDGNGTYWLLGRDGEQPLSMLCKVTVGTNVRDVLIFAGAGDRDKTQRAALITGTRIDFFNFMLDGEVHLVECPDFEQGGDSPDRLHLDGYYVISHFESILTKNVFLLLHEYGSQIGVGGTAIAVVDLLNQRLETRLSDEIDPDHDGLIQLGDITPGKRLNFGGQSITFSVQDDGHICHLVVGSEDFKSLVTIPFKYLSGQAPNDCGDVDGNGKTTKIQYEASRSFETDEDTEMDVSTDTLTSTATEDDLRSRTRRRSREDSEADFPTATE